MSAEKLYQCRVKCNSGVPGTNDCLADEDTQCCNYISAIFSLGESFTVRYTFIVILILYAIVFALFDLIIELYVLCNPSGYTVLPTNTSANKLTPDKRTKP